jgi:hypothetical protein
MDTHRLKHAAVPAMATAICFVIILIAGELATFVPLPWLGNWTDHVARVQPHFVDRFFPFDAQWYARIATDGYVWNPAYPALKQDVAFFPLWPLILRLVALCVTSANAARWVVVGVAASFAAASIGAFHTLARRLLREGPASTATLLFSLYPAANFLLLSYPTGLMNLLCILALLALMDGRIWRAALFSGLVTAIGPLGLGTALTVCAMAALRALPNIRRAQNPRMQFCREMAALIPLGLLSVAGLIGFLLWQYVTLGDALAFIKAQEAWAVSLSWPKRIPRGVLQAMILPDFIAALGELRHAAHAATLVALQASLEKSLQTAALGVALIGVLASARLQCRPVLLQGAFTLALFIWFHSTSRPGNSTLRLTYCTIGMFLGMAWLLRHRPHLAVAVISSSAACLACGAFLSAAGYHVV